VIASLPEAALQPAPWCSGPFESGRGTRGGPAQIDPDSPLACPPPQSYLCLHSPCRSRPALPLCSLALTGSRSLVLEWVERVCDRRSRSRKGFEPAQVAELRAIAPVLARAAACNELHRPDRVAKAGVATEPYPPGAYRSSVRHLPAGTLGPLDQALRQCLKLSGASEIRRCASVRFAVVRLKPALGWASPRPCIGRARGGAWSVGSRFRLSGAGWTWRRETAADSLAPSERDGPGLLSGSVALAQAERAPDRTLPASGSAQGAANRAGLPPDPSRGPDPRPMLWIGGRVAAGLVSPA